MEWKICAASVCGGAHLEKGLPCQDAFHWVRTPLGLFAAVCDGAGSAQYSREGAQWVAQQFVNYFAQEALSASLSVEEITALVTGCLTDIRQQLNQLAEQRQAILTDFACTLVAACLFKDCCWLIHLGDGVAVAITAQDEACASLPENGEYVNQTWFITSPDWRERLRVTLLPQQIRHIILMSDGVQPFAMDKGGAQLFEPFIDPVLRFLRTTPERQGSEALHNTLSDPRTHTITGDDKTLLIGIRED